MFLFLTALLTVDPPSKPSVGERAAIVEARTAERIEYLKEQTQKATEYLKRAKRGAIDPSSSGTVIPSNSRERMRFRSRESKEIEIAECETELANVKIKAESYLSGNEFYFGYLKLPPTVGDFGHLAGTDGKTHVLQVLSKTSMLVKDSYPIEFMRASSDGTRAIRDVNFEEITLMITGTSTAVATNGGEIPLSQVFEVTGTKTYKNNLGSTNTVFVLEPLDTSHIEKILRERFAEKSNTETSPKPKQPILTDKQKAEKAAILKVQLAETFRVSDPEKAKGYAREAIKLSADGDAAKQAKEILEEM